jgi:hypothetical protein
MADICPICNTPSLITRDAANRVKCPRCGEYTIGDLAEAMVCKALALNNSEIALYSRDGAVVPNDVSREVARQAANGKGIDIPRSIISYVLRKRADTRPPVTEKILISILRNNSVPTPAEQANNLIKFLGEHLASPGGLFTMPRPSPALSEINTYGLLGIKTGKDEWNDLHFLVTSLEGHGLLKVNYAKGMTTSHGTRKIPESMSFTLGGWEKYEELKRFIKESRKAFVAMEFPDPNAGKDYFFQEMLLDQYLVPAVRKTGYQLGNALRSEPKAGNIHARLEVEIRSARFVIAELSHHNNGAYWEAGFSKGLGKFVIYMYNRKIGDSRVPHFDVGSDHVIFWEKDKPEKAAEELKAVIRATLFGEAVAEDQ